MAGSKGEVILNSGNIVNRIGKLRRQRALAWCIAVVAIGVAVAGWIRPVIKIVAERPVNGWVNKSDCMEYAETMCNN